MNTYGRTAYAFFICYADGEQFVQEDRYKSRRAARKSNPPCKWNPKNWHNSMGFIVKITLKKPGLIPVYAHDDNMLA